jgi:hypothetical protein
MNFVLTNAFSINMLVREAGAQSLAFVPVQVEAVKNLLRNEDWMSAIGHPDTAMVVAGELGIDDDLVNRVNVQLDGNTSLIVAQYTGPRLEAGATQLPDGAVITYWQVYHH